MSAAQRWLVLRLEAPLLAFGGVTVDAIGGTRDFPAASMLTGLIANALGWDRGDADDHQKLQDRLIFAARRDRENPLGILTDMQNAHMEKSDQGWTTRGVPEGRTGDSYGGPHRRQRDYHTDACVTVVFRLSESTEKLSLDTIAHAINYPARPLFIGRKPCMPSTPLLQGEVTAHTAYDALCLAVTTGDANEPMRAAWPATDGPLTGSMVDRVIDLADLRNWRAGTHSGTRRVVEGRVVLRKA